MFPKRPIRMDTVVTVFGLIGHRDMDLFIVDDCVDRSLREHLVSLDVQTAHIGNGLFAGAPDRVEEANNSLFSFRR